MEVFQPTVLAKIPASHQPCEWICHQMILTSSLWIFQLVSQTCQGGEKPPPVNSAIFCLNSWPSELWAASHTKVWGDLLLSHSNSLDWFSMHCWCMFWWDSSLSSSRTMVYCPGPADHCGNPSTTWEEGCHLVSSWKHHFPKVLGSVPLLPQNLRMFLLTLLIAPSARHY